MPENAELDVAALFDAFVAAGNFRNILSTFYQLCTALHINPSQGNNVYPLLRQFSYWKAQKLWKLLDKKVEQKVYNKQRAAEKLNSLVIGAGPCGLRSAIELALLGSRVVVIEERDKFSRNNVLHLWEFVICDLKSLGVKIFYPKFCAGSIEHISIRQLQCALLKTALCFGVQVHESVSFCRFQPPEVRPDGTVTGFRAIVEPKGHLISEFDVDVLIGADGKRNTIPGFPREEMRGRLAIGITANFVNRKTAQEERVPEISGVAYIFNQEFFKRMNCETGVDLENIVYYKDDTHYFVMTAKKQSLLKLGVIKQDHEEVGMLLSPENVDRNALAAYARSAADFATEGNLPMLEFAVNHRGQPDIAMFDFTSLFSSKCAVRFVEEKGKKLMMGIVGDSLHEPFWPTGSGCARGFLGVLDTAWLVREYGIGQRGLIEILQERESIYRLLAQVTKENMHKSMSKYTIDPKTRYSYLDTTVEANDAVKLIISDTPRRAIPQEPVIHTKLGSAHVEPKNLLKEYDVLRFAQIALQSAKIRIFDLDQSWSDGKALGALLTKFKPSSIEYAKIEDSYERLEMVFNAIEDELELNRPCSSNEWKRSKKRKEFVTLLVKTIKKDEKAVAKSIITPRAHTLKRRTIEPLKITVNAKRSEAIASLSASVFKDSMDEKNPLEDSISRHARRLDRLNKENETPPETTKTTPSRSDRKLKPDLVDKVRKFLSGKPDKENHNQQLRRQGRLDPSEVAELEKVLTSPQQKPKPSPQMSSQEEKIIRANAAGARQEAINGFSKEHELKRFEKYDEVIKASEKAAKRRDLAGIDPFNRLRRATTTVVLPVGSPAAQRSYSIEQSDAGPVVKPVASVFPKRQASQPEQDTLNPRRQEVCRSCQKVVYLAERLQVGAVFLHKNCFRCTYCCQPLRLGAYSTDKDLEYHYPERTFYFCQTHMQLPLREKIAKIGRLERAVERTTSNEMEEETEDGKRTPKRQPETEGVFLSLRERAELRNRNMELNLVPSSLSPNDQATPERAEFGAHVRSRPASVLNNISATIAATQEEESSSEDEEEEQEMADQQIVGDQPPSQEDEEEEGVEDELEDEDVAELERTINEMLDTTPPLQPVHNPQTPHQPETELIVQKTLERIHHRRASMCQKEFVTPARQASIQDEDVFYTPCVSFRPSPKEKKKEEEEPRGRAVSIAVDNAVGSYEKYMTPCAENIQKEKIHALEKLRKEARERAKLKTDLQLGIESSNSSQDGDRSSPETPRANKKMTERAMSMLDDMPSLKRNSEVIETETPTPPLPVSQPPQSATASKSDDLVERTPRRPHPPMHQHPQSMGLLATLFSPAAIGKHLLDADKLHCDSTKEKSILGNAAKIKLKQRRQAEKSTVEKAEKPLTTLCDSTGKVPCVAVAPSPRKLTGVEPGSSSLEARESVTSPILEMPTERASRLLAARTERILKQRDEEKKRQAQELQRTLEECEVRLETIRTKGKSYEKRLREAPKERFLLECWNSMVHEEKYLKQRLESLNVQIKQVELELKYKRLNDEFDQYNAQQNLSDVQEERRQYLLEKMLRVLSEKKENKDLLEKVGRLRLYPRASIFALDEISFDFRNAQPVFTA